MKLLLGLNLDLPFFCSRSNCGAKKLTHTHINYSRRYIQMGYRYSCVEHFPGSGDLEKALPSPPFLTHSKDKLYKQHDFTWRNGKSETTRLRNIRDFYCCNCEWTRLHTFSCPQLSKWFRNHYLLIRWSFSSSNFHLIKSIILICSRMLRTRCIDERKRIQTECINL